MRNEKHFLVKQISDMIGNADYVYFIYFAGLTVKDFSGVLVVISSNVETVIPLRPGVVGLYFLIPIVDCLLLQSLEELDFLTVRRKGHDGFFVSSSSADISSHSLNFTVIIHDIYFGYFNTEDFFYSVLDLRLVRIDCNFESVLLVYRYVHGLFGNNRCQNDVVCCFH